MPAPLEEWIERQAAVSAAKLAGAISATHLVFRRPGFGQSVRPAKGSILASPETDVAGGPDYFFHWIRDAAAVMEAVRVLALRGPDARAWIERFEDCMRFSLALGRQRGEDLVRDGAFRRNTTPDFQKFVRPDAELMPLEGERVLDDVRYGADGALDFIKWSRPQHDGAALEAIVALRFWKDALSSGAAARQELAALIQRDLDYSAARTAAPSYDIWEEELGHHYYPRLVQRTALEIGADWAAAEGDGARAARYRAAAETLASVLDRFWSDAEGFYHSRTAPAGAPSPKALDLSVLLATLHAGRGSGPHSVADPRAAATLARLKSHFTGAYALNRARGAAFALGRYPGDRYFDGGAWYLGSFAAAEFAYRRAALAEGDAVLEAVSAYVPESGELSEQFHPATGAQLSARNLTWSYAAFITAWHARKAAVGAGR